MTPGLIRSIAHRVASGQADLPIEGRLASFDGATGWLNSPPLSREGLRGRVVLVDFWTFTCVNWLRTLPYVRAWSAKYADAGLTVIGVHTPEFGFEHDAPAVEARVRDLGIEYPVALDNDYAVWDDFSNHYWPALYLADETGSLRFHHFGEGEYAYTEMAIQQLLIARGATTDPELVSVKPEGLEVAADWGSLRSPETYLGYGQSRGFRSENEEFFDIAHRYTPQPLALNQWDLAGDWTVGRQAIILNDTGGRISFRFHARDLNLVMGPGRQGERVTFRVTLDGADVGDSAGTDVDSDGRGEAARRDTFQLVRTRGPAVDRTFEIEFATPGVEAYCVTFG